MTQKSKGIMWFIAQCITVPITICCVRYACDGANLMVILLIQNFMSLVMLGSYMAVKRISVKTKKIKIHVIRNIFGLGSWVCFFYAINNMPLNAATAITFTGPLVSTIVAALLIKEKLHRHRIIGLIIGFAGMLVLLHPEAGAFNEYGIYAFAGVILISITFIFFHILNQTESQLVIVFYMTLLSTLMMLPFGIYYWETPAAENIFWAFMVAAFAIFNVFAIVTALKHAGIGTLMPFDFTRLIVTAILAYFLFDEQLDVLTLIGAIIILSSAIYVVRKEHASY